MKKTAIDFTSNVPITGLDRGIYRVMADNAEIELKQSEAQGFKKIYTITASNGYGGEIFLSPNDSIKAIFATGTASIAKIDD